MQAYHPSTCTGKEQVVPLSRVLDMIVVVCRLSEAQAGCHATVQLSQVLGEGAVW